MVTLFLKYENGYELNISKINKIVLLTCLSVWNETMRLAIWTPQVKFDDSTVQFKRQSISRNWWIVMNEPAGSIGILLSEKRNKILTCSSSTTHPLLLISEPDWIVTIKSNWCNLDYLQNRGITTNNSHSSSVCVDKNRQNWSRHGVMKRFMLSWFSI